MDAVVRRLVWERARNRCEYCRMHQDDYDFQTFHIEHIHSKQHGGSDDPENLCLACAECNWAKGPNVAGILHGQAVALFHPRKQTWTRHFRFDGTRLIGRTKVGLLTVQLLDMNHTSRLLLRENLHAEGRFSPQKN